MSLLSRAHRSSRIVSLLLAVPASVAFTAPRELVLKDLGTLGGNWSSADALNDRGQVVGTSVVAPNEVRPFLWESGRMIDLGPGNLVALDINNRGQILLQESRPTPFSPSSCFLRDGDMTIDLGQLGGDTCFASDLNNRGQVVGAVNGHGTRAFLWQSGIMIDIGSLGGDYVYAMLINDRGQIVGGSTAVPVGTEHAFLWEDGVMIDLGEPGADWSRAVAINNRGQVVLVSGGRVFLWDAGSMTDLGTLGGDTAQPLDINDRGQILVAVWDGFPNPPHYVIWDAGTLIPLHGPAGETASANRLNNRGEVVGAASTPSGFSHAVLWTPRGSPAH